MIKKRIEQKLSNLTRGFKELDKYSLNVLMRKKIRGKTFRQFLLEEPFHFVCLNKRKETTTSYLLTNKQPTLYADSNINDSVFELYLDYLNELKKSNFKEYKALFFESMIETLKHNYLMDVLIYFEDKKLTKQEIEQFVNSYFDEVGNELMNRKSNAFFVNQELSQFTLEEAELFNYQTLVIEKTAY